MVEELPFNHRQPIFSTDLSSSQQEEVQFAQSSLIKYRRGIAPWRDQIEDIWIDRHLATVDLPNVERQAVSGQGVKPTETWEEIDVIGLEVLDAWKSLYLKRLSESAGYGTNLVPERTRVFMPPDLMSGALEALNDALKELELAANVKSATDPNENVVDPGGRLDE